MRIIASSAFPMPAKHILIIDDDFELAELLKSFMESEGFAVQHAPEPVAGLSKALSGMIDLIILDIIMPVMDGFEFMVHLRRLPGGDQPKVVFCTTENDIDHISKALHGGANEYIMKPFDKDIVAEKFQQVGLISTPV